MNIGAAGSTYEYSYTKTVAVTQITAKEAAFSKDLKNKGGADPLEYYKALCAEFPDITFRLDDKSETYLGYNNSLNQIGKGFGGRGQCSVSLDIAVIEKMQKDPKYEEQVKGLLEDSRQRYSEFEADAAADEQPYVSVVIEDNHGTPQRGIVQSKFPYSTEDEVKRLHAKHSSADVLKKFEADRQAMIDAYLAGLDESRRKQAEFWRAK